MIQQKKIHEKKTIHIIQASSLRIYFNRLFMKRMRTHMPCARMNTIKVAK